MVEVEPENGLIIKNDVKFKSGIYKMPDGLKIEKGGITLEGNGALILGCDQQGKGISILNRQGVIIRNLRLSNFYHGIYAQDCASISVTNCQITNTSEVPANSEFLDIWQTHEHAPGGAVMLLRVRDSAFTRNNLQHQQNGVLAYYCSNLLFEENITNYCSGWGFHLYETCDSRYISNCADFCCRFEPRLEGGWNHGHMGADSAGFLIVHRSCRNVFRKNLARMSGDGFFIAGLTPQYEAVGCNDNLFEENDGSYSPNIAFESTFSRRNTFRSNFANFCNYGFWLGFSREGTLEHNNIQGNRQAGIACENGIDFIVRGNHFNNNNHGILIWSKHIQEYERAVQENNTSHDWLIEENSFTKNNTAMRIAGNHDHGIRPLPASGELGIPAPRPFNHIIRQNQFSKNITDFDIVNVDPIKQQNNQLN
jgi:parallel beta-helix repeat protein